MVIFSIEIDCINKAIKIEMPNANRTAANRCDNIDMLSLSKCIELKKILGSKNKVDDNTKTFKAKNPEAAVIQNGNMLLLI